ncbi:MAG: porin family protein [Candidatus Kryptoniota bacterium]
MKTIKLVLFISILALCDRSHAQLIRAYGLKLGTDAANESWVYTTFSNSPSDNRWGFTVDGFVEFFNLPFFSGVAEIQYTQKGMMEKLPVTTDAGPEGTGQFLTIGPSVNYLSIPLLAKVRFERGNITPYLIAGPRMDFLLSKNGNGYDLVVNQFKTSEFGATFGVGVELTSILPVGALAEFRYNPSFDDALNNGSVKVRNRSFDFLLGVRL